MILVQALKDKIKKLEERLDQIESDRAYTDALYQKAVELVTTHHKSSVIFLQKHLLIDFHRASQLLEKLRTNGVV